MAVPTDQALQKLLDEFVCVRLVQMWDVDLELFQFDFMMTWAVFFMNADKTIYGRYGSRSGIGKTSMRDISLPGFKQALRAALELHGRYGADREAVAAELAGKQTQHEPPWRMAQDIPALKERKLAMPFTGGPNQHFSCIHCHMVPNHEMWSLQQDKKPVADRLIWPFPMPEVVGMQMDPRQRATVQQVQPASAAAAAGVERGDAIARFDGQPILSTADLQWVLHNAGDAEELALEVERHGRMHGLTLRLEPGWRRKAPVWSLTNYNVSSLVVGFNCDPLPPREMVRLGIAPEELALKIRRVNADKLGGADLRPGDVIVEIDDRREAMTFGEFVAYLVQEKKRGSVMKVLRRRGEDQKLVRLKVH